MALIEPVIAKPDLASIALLLVVVFLSLKILDMLRRTLVSWVLFFFRLAIYFTVAVAGVYVWNRGIDGTVDDIQHWSGRWHQEWQYWEDQAVAARAYDGQMGWAGNPLARQAWRRFGWNG
ncbi:hypothetical protein P152DRAFT_393654 [Eremomyces bilateralis CBS 781.70]|uniref:Uncharacterized protein n=1 Tax=Eremomyces bilateralis CBS 781.70 TaxID=1392243 RepID=A0A6G1G8M6_9PEZI|nr:uncharacterized protein P152DRAFT_393654 [Eremomyces bilateralis CBS 781.70]KAF1814394.1 hypothetical protein P152DRAFT_393654 [Eremomyces bilateralis CBS 781.70]